MLNVLIAEAVRRVRRRLPRREPGSDVPIGRLITTEVVHLVRVGVAAPATVIVLMGLATAAGIHVALGPGYPGPVAPVAGRWALLVLVLAASVGVARTAPPRWRDVRRAVWRARVGLVLVASAASVSLVKVGLHDTTPGPVLPAPARWVAVAAIAVIAIAVLFRHGHRPGARRDGRPGR